MRLVLLAVLAAACRATPKDASVDTAGPDTAAPDTAGETDTDTVDTDTGGPDSDTDETVDTDTGDTDTGDTDTGDTVDTDTGDTDTGDTDTGETGSAPTDLDGDGFTTVDGDCDDADPGVRPGAAERCDGIDEDCDGEVDEDASDATPWYEDADGDGYGVAEQFACIQPDGTAAIDGDCDDADATVHPGAAEACTEAVDRDCDGSVTYTDADGDGTPACEDCDDLDAGAFPGGVEVCGGGDEDCDGSVDDGALDALTWYADADGDGYGDAATIAEACDAPASHVADASDCDDTRADVSPAGVEVCDGATDEDCDGLVDDADASVTGTAAWFEDLDGDGYGGAAVYACVAPGSTVGSADDCDDTDAAVNPAAAEVCGNGVDDDCDGPDVSCGLSGTYAAGSHDFRFEGATTSAYFGAGIAIADLDGDGTEEVLGGARNATRPAASGATAIWYGPLTTDGAYTASADAVLTGTRAGELVGAVLADGDLDGDGVDDLLSFHANGGWNGVRVDYGGARHAGTMAMGTVADASFEGDGSDGFASWMSSGGDLDGDGADELVVGADTDNTVSFSAGSAWLFYGSTTAITGTITTLAADAAYYGSAVEEALGVRTALVRDMDGDGLDELLIGANGDGSAASDAGAGYLFLGDATRLAGVGALADADETFAGTAASATGGYVSGLGDLDGDGYAEAGMGAPWAASAGTLWVYGGGLATADPIATLEGQADDGFGFASTSPGDIDGDGIDELVVSAHTYDGASAEEGRAYLFYGPLSGTIPATAADATFYGDSTYSGTECFGMFLPQHGGDVTGDGVPDVVIGSPIDQGVGGIYVWAGIAGL